ncbi:hypothetical protein NQ318_014468 [Aromia moschata]|uniref:Partial AB-hydrolase lipase domain-containing protein n=1 Tax=Aromia moschata TaxID=1265417 RepID=A0AAV8YM91_9CUCU|nr:hypothetical protein NQ318_014468 [Aromia moschata]
MLASLEDFGNGLQNILLITTYLCFHEFGVYDNPAIIDYILNATENEKVSYIGHSEGTTQFFIMGSMRPEYNDKINVMAALAPIAYMGNATSPLVLIAKKYDQFIYELVDYLNLTWLLSYSKPFADTLELLCGDDSDFQEVCVLFVFTLCGFDNDQMDRSMFSKIFKSTPAGISVYQLTHYLQEIVSGHFRQYDYGSTKNLEIYNTTEPPDYDLAAVSAPLALFYSQNDFFAALSDVERLKETLPNVVEDHLMEHKFFNHLDFIYGKDVGSLVYFNVVNVLNAHNNLGSLTSKATTLTTDSMSSDATSSSYSSDSTDLTTSVSPTTEGGATTSFSSMQLLYGIKGFLNDLGYPFERHEVVTEDGYLLGVHRIPHGKNELANTTENKQKPAVIFMHGLLSNSVDFFILGPGRSLPLMLADEGYDVWLGNNRGNTWSRNHTTLDPEVDKEFWDYSFHEFGVYDGPAIIDYILNETGNEKVTYVGHSEGTTQFFIMGSMRPDYNDKINLMVALAPVVYMEHITSPLIVEIKKYDQLIYKAVDLLNITWILSYSKPIEDALERICSDDSDFQEMCVFFLFLIFGFDNDQMDRSMFSKIFKTLPAGASVFQLTHYLQEIVSGHFRQYDYGVTKNMEIYNATEPPDYNLAAVTAPLALFYSLNDFFVGLTDLDRLTKELPSHQKCI